MLTRRKFGLASIGLAASAAGSAVVRVHAAEETMTRTTEKQFEITKSPEEWRKILTPEQYSVMREHGTRQSDREPSARDHHAGIRQRLDHGVVGLALLALVVDDAFAGKARRVVGIGAVLVDGVGDGRVDAALIQIGRAHV